MADLDGFFAKKDKKKSKKKGSTSDEMVKKFSEKDEKSIPLTKKKQPVEHVEGSEVQEEDEWKEIEEERRDYTGLKIGQLTINEDDQDQDGYADGEQTEGETGTSNIKGQDPWKKSGSTGVQLTNVGNLTSTPATNLDSASQVYVSPAVKSGARLRGKGIAPDLSNEEYFPSLGAEKPLVGQLKKGSQFEEIKHGAKLQKQTHGNAPLSINNRYTSLESDGTIS